MTGLSKVKRIAFFITMLILTVPFIMFSTEQAMFALGICSLVYVPILIVWVVDYQKYKQSDFETYEQFWHYHHNQNN